MKPSCRYSDGLARPVTAHLPGIDSPQAQRHSSGATTKPQVRIRVELKARVAIEEEIFYPAFKAHGDKSDDAKMYFEALEEHRAAGDLVLPDLLGTAPDSEKFSGRAKVLKELVTHHADEEEKEMFPRAKKLMNKAEMTRLGEQMATRKAEVVKQLKADATSNARK